MKRSSRTIGNDSAPRVYLAQPWLDRRNTLKRNRCGLKAIRGCWRGKKGWESRIGITWTAHMNGSFNSISYGAGRRRLRSGRNTEIHEASAERKNALRESGEPGRNRTLFKRFANWLM